MQEGVCLTSPWSSLEWVSPLPSSQVLRWYLGLQCPSPAVNKLSAFPFLAHAWGMAQSIPSQGPHDTLACVGWPLATGKQPLASCLFSQLSPQ